MNKATAIKLSIFHELSESHARSIGLQKIVVIFIGILLWSSLHALQREKITVSLFLTEECQYCQKALSFFDELEVKTPWLNVQKHYISKDKSALELYAKKLEKFDKNNYAVPSIFFCDTRWIGFYNNEDSGVNLESALKYCYKHIEEDGHLSPKVVATLKSRADAYQFQLPEAMHSEADKFIPIVAIINALTPCAFFLIAALYVFLSAVSKKEKVVLSVLLAISLAVANFLHTNLYLSHTFYLRVAAMLVGILLLVYLYAKLKHKKNKCVYDFGVAILTFMVIYPYQQNCGFLPGSIFYNWLDLQNITSIIRIIYIFSYFGLYLLPTLIIGIVFAIFQKKVTLLEFKHSIFDVVYLVFLAILLIIKPQMLSSIWLSLSAILIASIIAVVMKKTIYR